MVMGGHQDTTARRLLTWAGAVVLVCGSIGLASPALGAQSGNGNGNGNGHAVAGKAHAKSAHHTGRASGHGHSTGTAGSPGGSHGQVSLPRPNDFQAQADPDGLENGGVDQPGGTGGIDTTSQDGNNGSGNDADCEDDNNGVGIPGHCRPAPVTAAAGTPADGTSDITTGAGDLATSTGAQDQLVSAPTLAPVLSHTATGIDQTTVRGVFGTSAPPARAASGVLPDTGAGRGLLPLSIAALAALALGAALVRRGRRTATR
jgi:hypothetical protein